MARPEQVITVNPMLEEKFGLSYLIKSGKTLYMAGILSADEQTFSLVGAGDMAAQIRHIYDRMQRTLAKAGCTLQHVVSEISFTTDVKSLADAGWVRREIYQKANAAPPVATAVQVAGLYLPGAMLEIHATAELP
ncbi:MAG: Rid family hydrolase [Rhodospirillaceae bacterium]|nr:Rid family hydrolase [Rhodospirillaceae bacterium]